MRRRNRFGGTWSGAFILLCVCAASVAADVKPLAYCGVSLAGAEFGPESKPEAAGVFGKDYTYPTDAEIDYFRAAGMNVLRVAFRWERLRPTIDGPLDPHELARLEHVVRRVTRSGGVALLDPHNYARYYGQPIGSKEVPAAALASFWGLLAEKFKDDDRVWFGLMNEPHDLPDAHWLAAANASIRAIRAAGAKNLILVPGNAWSGAHSWTTSGNATLMLGIKDPLDHYVFEVHQYLDGDSSGRTPEVVRPTIGSERLKAFTDWCRTNKKKAFLGEFAAADHADGRAATADVLAFLEVNADVWTGWCWWAAGPWWHDYMFSLEPRPGGGEAPQMAWLKPHFPVAGKPYTTAMPPKDAR